MIPIRALVKVIEFSIMISNATPIHLPANGRSKSHLIYAQSISFSSPTISVTWESHFLAIFLNSKHLKSKTIWLHALFCQLHYYQRSNNQLWICPRFLPTTWSLTDNAHGRRYYLILDLPIVWLTNEATEVKNNPVYVKYPFNISIMNGNQNDRRSAVLSLLKYFVPV